jgi:hypothetical protein
MKKFVTQRLKPPKAPRAKKAKKEVDPNAQPKAKKPRTKKETKVAKDTEQDIVAQLVEAANAPMTPIGSPPAVPVEPPALVAKKARKPRAKKDDAVATAVAEDINAAAPAAAEVKAPKEKKPRAKKVKETAPVPAPVEAVANDESEDEEIHTQEITIGNKTFLIDTENNLYSVDTHDQVGTFDSDTNEVVAC